MPFMDWVHGTLDVAGMVPVIGEVADGVNAGLYAAQGDFVNAGISLAGMIPVGGQAITGTRVAVKVGGEVLQQAEKQVLKEGGQEITQQGAKISRTVPKVIRRLSKSDAKEELVKKYPKKPGMSDVEYDEYINNHLESIDWDNPVELVEFKKGDQLEMWVRDEGKPGSYACDVGADPNTLGINGGVGRHSERITFNENTTAIKSTVKPDFKAPGVDSNSIGGQGGGVQYQLGTNAAISTAN